MMQYTTLWCQLCSLSLAVTGFQVPYSPGSSQLHGRRISTASKHTHIARIPQQWMSSDDVVDVEFERTSEPPKGSNSTTATMGKSKKTQKKSNDQKKSVAPSEEEEFNAKSLFELSLDSDPQWKEARVPFIDQAHQRVIDGKLAFVVEMEGVTYGIAVPFDAAAAIAVEDTDGSVRNMSPDDDENEEIMEIMATQLHDHLGEDLTLKRTPKVLTIEGDLDQYTKNWEEDILPSSFTTEELLDESDEDLAFFHDFMKRELGEEEYERTMAEPATQDSIPDEIMELFDVPGLGEREDDTAGMEEMLQSLLKEEDPSEAMRETLDAKSLEHDGVALKLISYRFRNGKSYSLVQLMKPVALVGKYAKDNAGGMQFELLTAEDEKIVMPKLEEICQKDLEDAGLELAP